MRDRVEAARVQTRRSLNGQEPPLNSRWLTDLIGDATYEREGDDLQVRGLYLDKSPWRAHVFALATCDEGQP